MHHVNSDRRQVKSAKLFVKALYELLEVKDIEEITVSEIAKQTEVGRTTFYRSFDTVTDVLLYDLDQTLEGFKTVLMKNEHAHHLLTGEVALLEPTLAYWAKHEQVVLEVIKAGARSELLKGVKNIFAQFLDLHAVDVKYRDYIIDMLASAWVSVIVTWIINDRSITVHELSKIYRNEYEQFHEMNHNGTNDK